MPILQPNLQRHHLSNHRQTPVIGQRGAVKIPRVDRLCRSARPRKRTYKFAPLHRRSRVPPPLTDEMIDEAVNQRSQKLTISTCVCCPTSPRTTSGLIAVVGVRASVLPVVSGGENRCGHGRLEPTVENWFRVWGAQPRIARRRGDVRFDYENMSVAVGIYGPHQLSSKPD